MIKRIRREKLKNKTIIRIGIVLILIGLIILFLQPQNIILKKIYKLDYSEYVYKYSNENDLDPFLVFSIIKAESNFQRNIDSSSGAIGLMQLMESTAVEMANEIGKEVVVKEALYNPDTNIFFPHIPHNPFPVFLKLCIFISIFYFYFVLFVLFILYFDFI